MLKLEVILFLIAVLTFCPFLLYLMALIIGNIFVNIKQRLIQVELQIKSKQDNFQFVPVSIIIPTHNEEKVIKEKIMALTDLDYLNEIEIIVVDDSTDSTPEIIRNLMNKNVNLRIEHSSVRKGYNEAILQGINLAKYEIVVITDSHSLLNTSSLETAVIILQTHENYGSVSGKCNLLNTKEISSKSENIYQGIFNLLRNYETKLNSTFMVKGEFTVLKKNVISDLINIEGCFDNESSFWIISKGYNVCYSSKINYSEYFPTKISERFQQKKVRAINLLKSIWRFKNFFFNYKFGFFGLVSYPFYFYATFMFPIILIPSSLLIISSCVLFLLTIDSLVLYLVVPAIVILIILIPPTRNAIVSFFQIEMSLLYAIYMIVIKSSEHISEIPIIESTRIKSEILEK